MLILVDLTDIIKYVNIVINRKAEGLWQKSLTATKSF